MPVALGVNGGVLGSNNLPTATTFRGVFTPNEVARAIALGFWPVNKSQAVTGVAGSGALGTLTVGTAADPYFEYTTLLLPGNGTNGAQNNTFLDSSTNNFTITRSGNTTQGTFSPFSQTGWSNYFSGTSGQYLNTVANAAFNFGTSDFTVEAWVFPGTAIALPMPIVEIRTSASNATGFALFRYASAQYLSVFSQGAIIGNSTNNLTQNAWNHVALVRSGNTWTFYINGVSSGSFTWASAQTDGGSTGPKIGGSTTAGEVWVGYLSNVRIVKGVAVYTGAFTPPTSPLAATQSAGTNISAITGTQTSLLTCQSNRFIDNSTNNFTITRNGDTSVVAFSPFNPTASWSAATYGGSGYFDGSGDYLSAASNTALNLTGDYTVECWFYANSFPTQPALFGIGSDAAGLVLTIVSSKVYAYFVGVGNVFGSGGTTLITNSWNHIAIVRSGTTNTCYINGSQSGTTYSSSSTVSSTGGVGIGRTVAGTSFNDWNGYVADFRIVKGTAVYTGAFTPPTAPLTAITNTSLLLNFTNAGIYDATSKNDLETVGNAQISTTQSKWGGSSIAFDGTGDYLITNVSTADLYSFGTGDWTVEFWVRFNNTTGDGCIFDTRNATDTLNVSILRSTTTIIFQTGGATRITSGTITSNVWYHVALARSGTSTKMFIDGTQAGSTYTDTTSYTAGANRPIVGAVSLSGFVGISALNGYVNDLRVTKGYARYTANFTPPTAAFPTL